MVEYIFDDVKEISIPSRFIEWVAIRLNKYQITYILCSEEKILEINQKYLGHDYYTDIITFDLSDDEGEVVEADIFISLDTVRSNAQKNDASFEEEIIRVMSHGVLHLIGYDDKEEEDRLKMREEENRAIEFVYNNVSRETI